MTLLSLENLRVSLRNREVIRGVSLEVGEGECVGLIGPNGAGKTTLMRAALGLLPHGGESSVARMAATARARHAAWMPQTREIAWPVSVETLVTLGRIPYLGSGQKPTEQDLAKVEEALAAMDLGAFRSRTATNLSGGEQARAMIARVLAQDTPLILADEPVAGLDPAHQISTMRAFAALAGSGRSVIISLHDLGLAARYCTRLVLLSEGRLVADGAPREVLTPDRMAEVFGISAYYRETEDGPIFQPLDLIR